MAELTELQKLRKKVEALAKAYEKKHKCQLSIDRSTHGGVEVNIRLFK